MKCKILHESDHRMRVHMVQSRMTYAQADQLEEYLSGFSFIKKAKVNDRTMNAVVEFSKENKARVIRAFSEFDYETAKLELMDSTHSGRALQHEYEDRMCMHILKRLAMRLLLPVSIRQIVTMIKAVPYLIKGIQSLRKRKLEVSVLDAISIMVSLLRGDHDTAGSVMFLLGVGDIMEEWTHKKSVNDLAHTMSIHVEKVWIRTSDEEELLVDIRSIRENDHIVVRMGNVIPLDGIVYSGDASVNQASMTGESLPVPKSAGSSVYAGTVVEDGEIEILVKQAAGSGRYDRIISMIEESERLKSSTEARAARLADRLVPYTLGATMLTWLLTRSTIRAASILMVDFCCALKLAMPIAVLSAMREAGEYNITVKGGKFLEAVAEADTVIFDKTGTLTYAQPHVKDVITFGGKDKREMLRLAACLEEHYPHSVANAVVHAAKEQKLAHEEKHAKVEYIVAHGIASSIDGVKVCIGSHHFIFEDEGVRIPEGEEENVNRLPGEYSHLYMAMGGWLCAVILIEDPLRMEAPFVIRQLHELGLTRVVMMTGDSERTARQVAEQVGVDEYYAEVLPEDKAEFVAREHKMGRKVIMIGDGINDSPALSRADVGIAVSSGAAIAREVADITIASGELRSLLTLRELSVKLMKRIDGNYHHILGFNSFLILMGITGLFMPTTTAFLHNTSTIAISMHSMRNLLTDES